MNSFSIRDIENICGIKAHTLRIWEQRYPFFRARRKVGNHREYDSEDLKFLLRIAYLYHHGYKISAIARLDPDEICRVALTLSPGGQFSDLYVNQLTEASLDLDAELFDTVLDGMIGVLGFEKTMTEVVYPFLNRIGLLWLTGNVVPAQEHFASALISKKIHVAIDGLKVPVRTEGLVRLDGPVKTGEVGKMDDVGPTGEVGKTGQTPQKIVLLFTPRGEFHEIPLLYMHYLMKKNGTTTVYFGKDIATADIEYYCRQQRVTHLYFHLVTKLMKCEPEDLVNELVGLFPDKEIVISGVIGAGLRGLPSQVRILKGMEEMVGWAAN